VQESVYAFITHAYWVNFSTRVMVGRALATIVASNADSSTIMQSARKNDREAPAKVDIFLHDVPRYMNSLIQRCRVQMDGWMEPSVRGSFLF
jgi:hypothetical protein